jgi:hypothetical protein
MIGFRNDFTDSVCIMLAFGNVRDCVDSTRSEQGLELTYMIHLTIFEL